VTTEGAYKATEASQGGVDAVILNAFTQAARNLLADEKFREIVAKGQRLALVQLSSDYLKLEIPV